MGGILHVCSANRCRSPLAELFMRAVLAADRAEGAEGAEGAGDAGPGERLTVTSAGTWTRGGEPMWEPAAAQARRRGLAPEGFRSRALTPAIVREADLVLAATRALRDEVVAGAPSALRRTFTWRELAWLLGGVRPHEVPGFTRAERVRALPALASARRGHLVALAPALMDVEDPVGGAPGEVAAAAELICSVVQPIAALVLTGGRHAHQPIADVVTKDD